MRTWNDLYKMLKNGEMDQSLIQTGCEDINAYRTRATEVMNGFEKTFGVKEDTLAALCSAPDVQKSVGIIQIISMDMFWRQQ